MKNITDHSRRDFLKKITVGSMAMGAVGIARADETKEPVRVDRRTLGRMGTDVSILGLGLGSSRIRRPDCVNHWVRVNLYCLPAR